MRLRFVIHDKGMSDRVDFSTYVLVHSESRRSFPSTLYPPPGLNNLHNLRTGLEIARILELTPVSHSISSDQRVEFRDLQIMAELPRTNTTLRQ